MSAIAKIKPMTKGSRLSSDEWCTPKWLTELLGQFDLDPCSNERSTVRALATRGLWGAKWDGLTADWPFGASVFVNPPYSDVGPWAAKLAAHQGPWCALLKNDPTTRWYATLMGSNPRVSPFRKRLRFEGDKAMTANFPSVLIYRRWEPSAELSKHLWIRSF